MLRHGFRSEAMDAIYADRAHAARILAEALSQYRGRDGVLVLGLPRGGIPIARGIAEAIGAPWDLLIVRKLGVPGQEELAMGAVASGGTTVVNREVLADLRVERATFERVVAEELAEVRRRESVFRGDRPPPEIAGRWIVLVDDGIATGATMRAAVLAVRAQEPAGITVAIPVAPARAVEELREIADEVISPLAPRAFSGISEFYRDFSQVSEVQEHREADRAQEE
jgi:putative phosphoribosyl transferase